MFKRGFLNKPPKANNKTPPVQGTGTASATIPNVPSVYSPPSLPGDLATILNFSYDMPGDPRSPLTPFKKRPTLAELKERLTTFFEAQSAPNLIPAAVQAANESWATFGDGSVAPSDFLRPSPSAPYRVVEIPGKGRGMRASRDLQAGDVVLAESPLIVLVKDKLLALNFFALPKHAIHALLLLHNKIPENKEFSLQQDSPQHRLLDYLKGVATTNAFEGPVHKGRERAGFIVLAGSLFNHSEEPNVYREFDVSSFKMTFTMIVSVKEGEELTVSYNQSPELLRSNYGIGA